VTFSGFAGARELHRFRYIFKNGAFRL